MVMSCAPVYREPETVRRAAVEALDSFELLSSREWIDAEHLPLGKDGSFHYVVRDERHWKVSLRKAVVAGANLFTRQRESTEHLRLDSARRGVFVSLLMHMHLWGREEVEVVNERGESLPRHRRRVLDPAAILSILNRRPTAEGCYPLKVVRALLEEVPVVDCPDDVSTWSVGDLSVICSLWNTSHRVDGGLWCTCALRQEKDL